ncbi:MAG: hypothetical protein AAFP19_08305 [Bacteroidota bacterium]
MKGLTTLLLMSLLILGSPSSNAHTSFTQDFVYTIHIGAFVKANKKDFADISHLGYLYAERFDYSLLRIYMGDFNTEAKAKAILKSIKAEGYPDAYITRRGFEKGKEVAVIQLGTESLNKEINWTRYMGAGPIFTQLNEGGIKVLTGTFADVEMARQRLGSIRKAGFKDAFVKELNNVLIHRIGTFEMGNKRSHSAGLIRSLEEEEQPEVEVENSPVEEPTVVEQSAVTPPPAEVIPEEYDVVVAKGGSTTNAIALPKIRKNVKRNSVYELQTILKKKGYYKSSLDGLYGKGTTSAYTSIMADHPQIRKYQILAQYAEEESPNTSTLQGHINGLIDKTSRAIKGLEQSKAPIAKAYRAYALYRGKGASPDVDQLMNAAIRQAYQTNKVLKNRPAFDYEATYTYKDLNQLLLHLRYVQQVSSEEIATPCWLLDQHPEETAYAFSLKSGGDQIRMAGCEDRLQWEELKLLSSVATDLNPNSGANSAQNIAGYATMRSRLIMAPKALSKDTQQEVENWHRNFLNGIDRWQSTDPLHVQMVEPLKIAYFQSMVRLEDYFMDKGFKSKEARGLAISTLQTYVVPHMRSYMK